MPAGLALSTSRSRSRMVESCCGLSCSGPSVSHRVMVSMLAASWDCSAGRPLTKVMTTKVRTPPRPANPPTSTRAVAIPLRTPRLTRYPTAGASNAASNSATATGTTMAARYATPRPITYNADATTNRHPPTAAPTRSERGTACQTFATCAGCDGAPRLSVGVHASGRSGSRAVITPSVLNQLRVSVAQRAEAPASAHGRAAPRLVGMSKPGRAQSCGFGPSGAVVGGAGSWRALWGRSAHELLHRPAGDPHRLADPHPGQDARVHQSVDRGPRHPQRGGDLGHRHDLLELMVVVWGDHVPVLRVGVWVA